MNKIAITLLVGSLALGGLGMASAGDGYPEKGGQYDGKKCMHKYGGKGSENRLERMTKNLGLSEEQVVQIRGIKEKYAPQKLQLRSKMQENRMQLRAAMHADPVDESLVQKLAVDSGKLKTDKILLKSKMRGEISQVLTAEQRNKKMEMMKKRGDKHRGQSHDS